jgi:hypothetical protein
VNTDTLSAYTPPSPECIQNAISQLLIFFIDFMEDEYGENSVSSPTVEVSALRDCFRRVHQRKHYFKVFHDMPNGMSEVKSISLCCFWLLKFRPFALPFSTPKDIGGSDSSKRREDKDFLERFCIYLLTRTLRRLYKLSLPLSDEGRESLVYSLRHHDITKEALTELFEMLEDMVKKYHSTISEIAKRQPLKKS